MRAEKTETRSAKVAKPAKAMRHAAAALALCLAFSLCACHASAGEVSEQNTADVSAATASPEQSVALPNPIHAMADSAALQQATGIRLEVPNGIADAQYSSIDGQPPTAQINFTNSGTEYTLRAGTSALGETLAGIYEEGTPEAAVSVSAAGGAVEVAWMDYPSGVTAQWQWGDTVYSLYGQDLSSSDAGTIWSLALALVPITAPDSGTADAAAYVLARENGASYPDGGAGASVTVSAAEICPPETLETLAPNGVPLTDLQLTGYCGGISWMEYLADHPQAAVVSAEITVQGADADAQNGNGTYSQWFLADRTDGGAFYVVAASTL